MDCIPTRQIRKRWSENPWCKQAIKTLIEWQEFDTNRGWHCHLLPGGLQFSRCQVNFKQNNRIASLIFGKQVFSGRIDGKIPWSFSTGWLDFDQRQQSCVGVNRITGDAIMPPIRTIDKFPGGMNDNLCRITGSVEIRGQGGDRLNLFSCPRSGSY